MKVSKTKVAEHRAALMAAAKKLLQERGFDGACVVDISREAGLTQGALYGQFKSKDDLVTEACRKAFADGAAAWSVLRDSAPDTLAAYLDTYLSGEHVTHAGSGCVLAACSSEVGRQGEAVGAVFADGFRAMVEMVELALPKGTPAKTARRRALTMVSAMVGTVAMARAIEKTDPALSKEVIEAARKELEHLAGR